MINLHTKTSVKIISFILAHMFLAASFVYPADNLRPPMKFGNHEDASGFKTAQENERLMALIDRVQAEDPQAFAEMRAFLMRVAGYFLNRYVPPHLRTVNIDIEGVVQEVFIKILNIKQYLRSNNSARNYIITMMKNEIINLLRHEASRHADCIVYLEDGKELPAYSPNQEEIALGRERSVMLLDSINRLQDPYRTSVVLYYYQGLSLPEIGERLGINEATIRSRVYRGRLQVIKMMNGIDPCAKTVRTAL